MIVSLIVNREDDETIRAKAEVVNAKIKLHYLNNHRVLVCHHDNLRDRKFRRDDHLHLTEHGTSRLENNLKFKIAESLGIVVVKKQWDNNRYDARNDRRENNWNNYTINNEF